MDPQDRELLIRIDERVGAISVQMAEVKEESRRTSKTVTLRLNNHADRVRKLELWRSWLAGGLAAIGLGVPLLIKVLF